MARPDSFGADRPDAANVTDRASSLDWDRLALHPVAAAPWPENAELPPPPFVTEQGGHLIEEQVAEDDQQAILDEVVIGLPPQLIPRDHSDALGQLHPEMLEGWDLIAINVVTSFSAPATIDPRRMLLTLDISTRLESGVTPYVLHMEPITQIRPGVRFGDANVDLSALMALIDPSLGAGGTGEPHQPLGGSKTARVQSLGIHSAHIGWRLHDERLAGIFSPTAFVLVPRHYEIDVRVSVQVEVQRRRPPFLNRVNGSSEVTTYRIGLRDRTAAPSNPDQPTEELPLAELTTGDEPINEPESPLEPAEETVEPASPDVADEPEDTVAEFAEVVTEPPLELAAEDEIPDQAQWLCVLCLVQSEVRSALTITAGQAVCLDHALRLNLPKKARKAVRAQLLAQFSDTEPEAAPVTDTEPDADAEVDAEVDAEPVSEE